ncbi:MAG TPA: hypothetical protein VE046_04460 [Steroidobacteraceae bacterium]|nr:hypothetical protein [Steroidobacteraceae bacterium]
MTLADQASSLPTSAQPAITELVLQRGDMLLIDRVVYGDNERVEVVARFRPNHPFVGPRGIPCWVGVELMAQAVAAFSGLQLRANGNRPRIGLLLGTRSFVAHAPYFPAGVDLTIVAELVLRDGEGIGVFDCTIQRGAERFAEAQLKGLAPADLTPFLEAAIDD